MTSPFSSADVSENAFPKTEERKKQATTMVPHRQQQQQQQQRFLRSPSFQYFPPTRSTS